MFVAQLKSGQKISILHVSRNRLSAFEKLAPFFCPSCKQELILKKGELKIPHFAHKTTCVIKPEGETEVHLQGKKKLYAWLRNQGVKPQLESYLPEINQRPDLLFQWKDKRVVIEFQCSVIPSQDIYKRTSSYLNHNYYPIWFLYEGLVKKSPFTIQLNSFISQFIFHDQSYPVIISFHPQKEEFITYTNIVPFSKNRAFCLEQIYTMQDPIDMILQPSSQRVNFLPYWVANSEKWLIQQSLFPDARKNKFLQFLYQRRLHPTSLPWEIGIPLPNMYIIETPPIEWQFYVWYFFLYTRKIGAVITKDEIPRFIFHKLHSYIRFRSLPAISMDKKVQPFNNYISFLTSIGFFKDMKDKLIVVKKPEILKQGNVDRTYRKGVFYSKNKEKILRFFI